MVQRSTSAHLGAVTAAAIGVALVLSACSSGSSGDSSSSSGGGKTLVVENSFDLKTADPGRVYEITGGMVIHSIYQPLLSFAGGDVSKPVPLLAKSFSVSADGKTMTLPLRDDVTFSDGTKMTSADVVFSFNRLKNLKGNPSFLLDGVTPSAPDDHTAVLTSAKPNPSLPFLLSNPALGIENSAVFKAHGATDAVGADKTDTAQSWLDKNSAGSGPYALQSFSTTSQVVLIANDKYWGDKPKYSKVVLSNVTANVQKLDVQKGQTQVALDLSPQQTDGLSGSVEVHTAPTTNTFFVFTNNNPAISKITSNHDFQTAVRYGLDYKSLVDLAGKGSIQSPGIIPTLFLGALPASQAPQMDVAKAKTALAASGYDGKVIELEYPSDLTKNGVSFGVVAQRVQAQLKSIGITIKLKPAPLATSLPNYRDGKEQMGLWLWGADYADPSDYLTFLPGETVGLRAGWAKGSDAALSALGDQAAVTTDSDARGKLYQQIQQKLNEGGPFMQLFQTAQVAVTAKSVSGFVFNPIWTVEFATLT